MTSSPSGAFKTRAGLINIAANKQEQFEALCRLLGRADLVTDPRFIDREDRKKRRLELKAEIESALAARSAQEWAALLNEHGVPAGEVLSIPEVLAMPQIAASGLVKHFFNSPGVDREIAVVRSGFRLQSGDPQPNTPPPALGADTDKILEELGYDRDKVTDLKRRGAV